MIKSTLKQTILFFSLMVLAIACQKGEDVTGETTIDSLLLTADFTGASVVAGQMVNFTTTGSDNTNYTVDTQFFVDGILLESSQYIFTTPGNYTVSASLDAVISNNLLVEVVMAEERMVVVQRVKSLRNQPINLSLQNASGADYTESATFYVNGEAISGNTFSSPEEGEFEVYADYGFSGGIFTSEISSFEVFVPKRKVVFEDYTGTWCGYCTAMTARVHEMEATTEDVSIVAIHVGNNDPFKFSQAQALIDYFEVTFIPTGFSNREYFYGDAWPVEVAIGNAGEEVSTTIGVASNLTGNELSVSVKVISEENMGTNKLVVLLLEDGLIYNQANSSNNNPESPYYQMGNPIPNFEHDDVLRESLTNIFGDPIPSTQALNKYTRDFSYTVSNDYNLNKLSLVVMVVDENNVAVNSQYADVGENKGFE